MSMKERSVGRCGVNRADRKITEGSNENVIDNENSIM